MNKVVIKVLQGSIVTQAVLDWLTISSSCKFPIVYNVYVPQIIKVGSQ